MHLADFDIADPADAAGVVRVWADIPGWVDAVVARRPYGSVEALAAYAGALARQWTPAELDAALAQHPRIGARVSGAGAEATASRREQAAMATATDDVTRAIARGNVAYEERFGRVFLIRAAGRTPAELRAELERRLANDDAAETAEATAQLAEIAMLRLRESFADDAPTEPEEQE
jgi:2-oxo-4-hydroxy-4-carboxy-5-ureidoimidazoline decarboxylase